MAETSINIPELKEKLIERLRPSGWVNKLRGFIHSTQFDDILNKLWELRQRGIRFTPPLKQMFRAFEECPYNDLKVIIIGQDPYPGLGIADGIAFSCSNTGKVQPSLRFILDEVGRTVYPNEPYNHEPDLKHWANQGVLLLNAALSCEIGKPGTHYPIWDPFMAYLVDMLNSTHSGLIWILMGAKAKELGELINSDNHHVLLTSHPASALYSGANSWDSNNAFTVANMLLYANNGPEYIIKW